MALARASLDDVLKLWEGLGYYGRARLLHRAALLVLERFGGRLPATTGDLLSLPGNDKDEPHGEDRTDERSGWHEEAAGAHKDGNDRAEPGAA